MRPAEKQKCCENIVLFTTIAVIILMAIYFNNLKILWLLLLSPIPMLSLPDLSRSKMHVAAMMGDLESIKKCLDGGEKVDVKDGLDRTPLNYAIANNQINTIDLLLRNGANINSKNISNTTPLHQATLCKQNKIVETLIDRGASINDKDNEGKSVLHYAASQGQTSLVMLFLNRGITIDLQDNQGKTALHHAALNSHKDIVKLLIANGDLIDREDNSGLTPLQVLNDTPGCKGITKNFYEEKTKQLHNAVKAGNLQEAHECIIPGVNLKKTYSKGKTLLHLAAEKNYLDISKLLIEKGAQVNITDKEGRTALHLATENNYLEIAKLLIEKGTQVDSADKEGRTALHLAAENNHLDISRLLIEKAAQANITDKEGKTALDLAAEKEHMEIISLLIKIEEKNFGSPEQSMKVFRELESYLKKISEKLSELESYFKKNRQELNQWVNGVAEEIISEAEMDTHQDISYELRKEFKQYILRVILDNEHETTSKKLTKFSNKSFSDNVIYCKKRLLELLKKESEKIQIDSSSINKNINLFIEKTNKFLSPDIISEKDMKKLNTMRNQILSYKLKQSSSNMKVHYQFRYEFDNRSIMKNIVEATDMTFSYTLIKVHKFIEYLELVKKTLGIESLKFYNNLNSFGMGGRLIKTVPEGLGMNEIDWEHDRDNYGSG